MKRLSLCASAVLFVLGSATAAPKLEEQAEIAKQQLTSATDAKERIRAIEKIGEIGQIRITYVESAVPEVLKALEDKDPKVRGAAAEALGKLDPELDKALPALSKLLKDGDTSVKLSAAKGLASIGPKAQPAVPALREAMDAAGDDNRVRNAMRNAVRTITGR